MSQLDLAAEVVSFLLCSLKTVCHRMRLLHTCNPPWWLKSLILMSQELSNESQHQSLMTHTMAPCVELIIAAYGRLLLLLLSFPRWSQRLTETLDCCGWLGVKHCALACLPIKKTTFAVRKVNKPQLSNQHEAIKEPCNYIVASLLKRWLSAVMPPFCSSPIARHCLLLLWELCFARPFSLNKINTAKKRVCAFCDMSLFPQSNSAGPHQSAQCLMQFAPTVFSLWPPGCGRPAELVEVFPSLKSPT